MFTIGYPQPGSTVGHEVYLFYKMKTVEVKGLFPTMKLNLAKPMYDDVDANSNLGFLLFFVIKRHFTCRSLQIAN